jgi:transcription elongation factor Elf1
MLPALDIECPYCGEWIVLFVDVSAGEQRYIEDCQVCCRPIQIVVTLDEDGEPEVVARAENDT